ncbi:MAG: phage head-tail connector protein [Pseudomonadota bacterium]
MNLSMETPPAVEPVALSDAKDFLRVDYAQEDTLIGELIASARARVEAATGLALIERGLLLTLDKWPERALQMGAYRLPVRPAAALTSVTIYAADDTSSDETSSFRLEAGLASRLVLDAEAWPRPGRRHGGIEIRFTAGFGTSSQDVADDLRLAVKTLALEAYRKRSEGGVGEDLSPIVADLLAPWRRSRL